MPQIILQKSAIDQIMKDDEVKRWLEDPSGRRVPYLGYFRRSYSHYHDGRMIEHGDGFALSTIDPHDPKETKRIVIEPVELTADASILVGGHEATMSKSFSIGWSQWKFTHQLL